MTCKTMKPLAQLYLYDELDNSRREMFEIHLRECPECRQYTDKMRSLFDMLSKNVVQPVTDNREQHWSSIKKRLQERPERLRFPAPAWRWSAAAAMFVAALLIGVFIGRFTDSHTPLEDRLRAESSSASMQMTMEQHCDDLTPLLMDYLNRKPDGARTTDTRSEKEIVHSLLLQNRLLQRRLSHHPDPYLGDLLEDLELILIEIAHHTPGNEQNVATIKNLIRRKGIRSQLRIINQKSETI